MRSRLFHGAFAVMVCTFPLLISGCSRSAGQEQSEPPLSEVIVDQAVTQDVQLYIRTQGEIRASQFVTIPARVAGFLKEIKFKPGDLVQEGQPLFQIEPDDYQAALESLEADLKINEAKELLAQANFERAQELIKSQTITPQDFQTYTAQLQEARGNIERTQAAITRTKLNLSYTHICSPVIGKTGPNLVDLGNLVGPGSVNTDLVTVAKMDPIHVYFDISDSQFNAIQKNAKQVAQADSQSVSPEGRGFSGKFSIALITGSDTSSDEGFDYEGTLQLIDNHLDKSTGTVILRGDVPNPDYSIFQGQICRVRIPIELIQDAVLVREEALNSDLNTKFLLMVDKDNVVRRRNVKIGELVNSRMRVILAGLKPGETYIYQGLQRARIDEKVIPMTGEEYEKKYNLPSNGKNGNGQDNNNGQDDNDKNIVLDVEEVSDVEEKEGVEEEKAAL